MIIVKYYIILNGLFIGQPSNGSTPSNVVIFVLWLVCVWIVDTLFYMFVGFECFFIKTLNRIIGTLRNPENERNKTYFSNILCFYSIIIL